MKKMELRAAEDIPIGVDVTPWIPPLAHCLHTQFLHSYCSSCFCPLPSTEAAFPCSIGHLNCPIFYCSPVCSSIDSAIHMSSGECRLLSLLPLEADHDATNLRLALRLAFSLDSLLPVSAHCPDRIGGLMTNIDKIRSLQRQAEELELLSLARESRCGDKDSAKVWLEDAALCAVLTNAVEVMLHTKQGPIGAAVYPPSFSWFNHSCTPNALFRFKLFDGCHSFGRRHFLVEPYGEDDTVIKSWHRGGLQLVNGLILCGPRVIARSIKSIRRGEEVCITYVDPLLPKGIRQSELRESYLFDCGCHRCSASPPAHVDRFLQGIENPFKLFDQGFEDVLWMRLNVYIEQSINKYRVNGDPEECCVSLEALLLQLFNYGQFSLIESQEARDQGLRCMLNKKPTLIPQLGAGLLIQDNKVNNISHSSFLPMNSNGNNRPPQCDPNQSGVELINELECIRGVSLHPNQSGVELINELECIRGASLHPMHHLLINSYIALASAYKVSASQKLANGDTLEAFRQLKSGTAYSLLLAGGIHLLCTLEPSLVPFAVEQWVDSGRSLLKLSKDSAWGDLYRKAARKAFICDHLRRLRLSETALSEKEFNEKCEGLRICIRDITTIVWQFLIHETPCLNFVKSPVDFAWLERSEVSIAMESEDGYDMKLHFHELGVHCLLIGEYLATICHGFECKLVAEVEALLRDCHHTGD